MAVYDEVLKVIASMALVIERNPKSFLKLDEESIRDHFLISLNSQLRTPGEVSPSSATDCLGTPRCCSKCLSACCGCWW